MRNGVHALALLRQHLPLIDLACQGPQEVRGPLTPEDLHALFLPSQPPAARH